jgi:hypothetical protein
MSTSTEQLNAAIDALTGAAAAYNGKVQEIDTALKSAADRWDDFETVFYVDQSAGDDANDGTQENPLASIQTAIDRAPFYGRVLVVFRGAYTTTALLRNSGRHVRIFGAGTDWVSNISSPVDFNLGTAVSGSLVQTLGFAGEYQGSWELYCLNLKTKTLAQVNSDHPGIALDDNSCAVFKRPTSGSGFSGGIHLRWTSIDLTADPYAHLIGVAGVWALLLDSITQVNPLAGRWVAGVAAGVDASTIARLHTDAGTL